MLCQICNENEATIRYTEMIDGNYTHYHICGSCAEKHNIKLPSPFAELDLGGSLTGLLGFGTSQTARTVCPVCQSSFESIARSGKAGCPDCYVTFRSELAPNIRQIHGAVRHAGKIPRSADAKISQRRMAEQLRSELDTAVKAQEYEKAAEIRDRIKRLSAGEGESK